jgi:TatD DNase family protein
VLIDAHIHLDDPAYRHLAGVIRRARANGVACVVAVGSGVESNARILQIARDHPDFVWPCLGLHPERPATEADLREVAAQIRRHRDAIVGIGEAGLPYYSLRDAQDPVGVQRAGEARLRFLADLAVELDLPLILHAPHEAAGAALGVLQAAGAARAMFHWHKAAPAVTAAICAAGYCLSVTPEVCYRDRDRALVRDVPRDRLLIETDGPWPFRGPFEGRPTEPAMLFRVAAEVAALWGRAPAEAGARLTATGEALFGRRAPRPAGTATHF